MHPLVQVIALNEINRFLAPRCPRGRPRAIKGPNLLNLLEIMCRTSQPWHMLPTDGVSYKTVHRTFIQLQRAGIFDRIHKAVVRIYLTRRRPKYHATDTTYIKNVWGPTTCRRTPCSLPDTSTRRHLRRSARQPPRASGSGGCAVVRAGTTGTRRRLPIPGKYRRGLRVSGLVWTLRPSTGSATPNCVVGQSCAWTVGSSCPHATNTSKRSGHKWPTLATRPSSGEMRSGLPLSGLVMGGVVHADTPPHRPNR